MDGKMVPPIIGSSSTTIYLKNLINRVARTGEKILICGETGVGKDLVAQNIYHKSNRVGKPFVKINCAELKESLYEIDLSHPEQTESIKKSRKKRAFLDPIDGGILYLDNIDLLTPELQKEILTILLDNDPLVFEKKVSTDICVISSASNHLEKMVKDGKFLDSLYYRLSTIRIEIEPLRERPDDILDLIDYYYKKYASAYNGRKPIGLGKEIIKDLCYYKWPGNVRELQNVIKRILLFDDKAENILKIIRTEEKAAHESTNNKTSSEMIPEPNSAPGILTIDTSFLASLPFKTAKKQIVNQAEKELISNVLEKTGWNRSKANKILNISYKTLLTKIQKLNIQPLDQVEKFA